MVSINLQNRHGKSSKAVTNDTEDIPEDSSAKRVVFSLLLSWPERKKPESSTQEKNSLKDNKRKREKKFETDKPGQKGSFKTTSNDGLRLPKRSRYSNDKNPNVGRPEESEKGKKSWNNSFSGGGGKRKTKVTSTAKDKAASHVPIGSSKSHKLQRKFKRN
ncbi:hypothetical protein JHK82_027589 [Glycine max]|nr:hypothetical protein JHK85_028236 [Glycine max]KAG5003576.1 hypothetical protein JHK86_027715 [Glycine max]KAG5126754.1 hypothetical protein JHK82_027589 [Glycine max]KAG5151364.1 hypothetical protein JHK84_027836 [Glycine max]